jgi:hypothetical protein
MDMLPNLINAFILLVIFLGVCTGVIYLQVFLSRKESKWLGLILPAFTFGLSVLMLLSFALFFGARTETRTLEVENIVLINDDEFTLTYEFEATSPLFSFAEPEPGIAEASQHLPLIINMIVFFIMFNIPTAGFLAIYAVCRNKRNRLRAVEKMSVQDL